MENDVTHIGGTIIRIVSAYYNRATSGASPEDGIIVYSAERREWVGYIIGPHSLQFNREVWHGGDTDLATGINTVISANRARLEKGAGHALDWTPEDTARS